MKKYDYYAINNTVAGILAVVVFLGLPYLFGEGWLSISWLPALILYGLMAE